MGSVVDLGLPPVEGYTPVIKNLLELEKALLLIKTTFETNLKENVGLTRVSCPVFLDKNSGMQDNLNGIEKPATFNPRDYPDLKLEVPHSLAKWKRWALQYYSCQPGQGIVTDFRGIRADDDIDYTHSLYVDQWDWEKCITENERSVEYLQEIVKGIYTAIYVTEQAMCKEFGLSPILPAEIHFASSDEMIQNHPESTPKEREAILAEKYGAVFLMGIGGNKADGSLRHDGRAPDYDDWITPRPDGGTGLNGDILVWHPVLKIPFELSSMGIRVNKEVLLKQLELCNAMDRTSSPWHKMLLEGEIPQSIGGGIGQSRLCQFMLRCCHIGEVQYGWYNPKTVEILKSNGTRLLGLGEGF
ncbi:Aspartate--ammonia ligase [Porphyridium purpureum]|uniref:Aspartate--ammonia ligase n=1 Tax=Porphyridium purpureum TaxID=35688 RepID=A0A5J4YY85_PORPP|nr:Aspartate--ammonia ligase [Porphyridium purpureum]|eukprot:POR5752..scf209_3